MKIFKSFGSSYNLKNNTLLVTREANFKFAKIVIIENENKFGIKLNNSNIITFYNKLDLKNNFYILILNDETEEDNEINIHLTNNETFINYSKSFEIKKPEMKQSFLEPVLLNKNCFGNEIIDESADNENIQKHNTIKREIIIDSKEIYGIPVKTINQTTIWKILKAICEKQDAEGTQVANQLFIKYPEIFNNSKRCLASKKKIAYINSILEEA